MALVYPSWARRWIAYRPTFSLLGRRQRS